MPTPRGFSAFLGSAGNDDTIAMHSANGSVTAVEFYVTPTTGETWEVKQLIVEILDEKNFQSEEFGAGVALTNGTRLYVKDADGDIAYEVLAGSHTLKANSDFAIWAESSLVSPFTQTTNAVSIFHLDFESMFGSPIVLKSGWKLCALVQDDINSLSVQEFEMCATGRSLATLD